jgi:TPR repeat protein
MIAIKNIRCALLMMVLAAVTVSLPTGAQQRSPLEDADAAYSRGDFANAQKLLRPLGDQGVALAQYRLAEMYLKGEGVPQDFAEAVKWYRLAANRGDVSAQYKLGTMYANGEGVPQDNILAHMWFNLSAAHGRQAGATNRDAIERLMSGGEIAEAQKLAAEWKPCTKWLWIFSRGNC